MIDKLKCRMVFRGDLYEPTEPEDSWNPFASYQALRMYLALCARYRIFPCQTDWVQAYLQCFMREKVYIKFPLFWKDHLPEDLAMYCGVPLELLRALYGYTYSGKRLYEEQEKFLKEQGFEQGPMLGIWVKRLPANGIFLLLLFADDLLSASTSKEELYKFRIALSEKFEISWKPVADWYLQARIQQDANGNISLDQSRYSKAIIQRYLPNAPMEASDPDKSKFLNPLPRGFKFSRDDDSKSIEEVRQLEKEYGYRFIEVVGSLNYLANTAIEELYAIRKLCKFTRMPGRKHYEALHHLLNHIRCFPTPPLVYYHNVHDSPLAKMLIEAGHQDVDPTLVYFTDSSFHDCDDGRSTGCYLGFLQGGLIDMASSVPSIISHSSAEAETTFASTACLATHPSRRTFMYIIHGDEDRAYTVPMFTDSQSSIDIAKNLKGTQRTKHMARRALYTRDAVQNGSIKLLYINGKKYQLADVGTKADITFAEFFYKLNVIRGRASDSMDKVIIPPDNGLHNQRGVLEIVSGAETLSPARESDHIPIPKRRKTISTSLDESRGAALPKAARTYRTGNSIGATDGGDNRVANDPCSIGPALEVRMNTSA
jgi:Reverse transcriptase (RNA-dependent DNA polymerase)